MLVESIEREADRTGRLADYHRAIAETLEALYPEQAKQTARRRADHYRRCDDPSLALEPMRLQAQHLRETGEFHDMLELLDRRDRLCDRLGLADEDRRRLQADILRLWAYNRFGETDRAAQLLDRIEPIIRRKGWHRELGDALMVRSRMASGDGDLEESIACSRSAQTHYETAGDTRGLAHAHTGQAFVHLRRGEYPRSIEAYDRAIALYDELGDTPSRVSAQAKKMMVRVAQKRFEDVWRDHSELLDEAQSIGARQQEATLWNIAGEAARYQERWQQARGCYRRARDIWTELDSRIRHIAELNLAMVELGAGRFAEARRRFESVEEGMRRAGLPSRLLRVFLGQAGCAAGQNDWAGWERALERVERQLEQNQDRNTDDPWLAEIAAGHAADRGHTDRARRMYRLARRLWHDIDEPDQAEAVDRTLATLD
jgi:tetratricopeptide (TPR) repeat protein